MQQPVDTMVPHPHGVMEQGQMRRSEMDNPNQSGLQPQKYLNKIKGG